ncbi:unnamed protein product [Brassica oleracea var. botrytis]
MLKWFDKKLRKIREYLNEHPGLVAVVASASILIVLLCFLLWTTDVQPSNSSMDLIQIVTAVIVSAYTFVVVCVITFVRKDHVPGRRKFPYAFTLLKSVLQIIVLLSFTCLDSYMKEQNRLLIVSAVMAMHIHLVSMFFAFHLGEDCDVVTAFSSASFTLVYELAKGCWVSVLCLAIVAILLMWIKNVLFLNPPPNPEGRDVEVSEVEEV